ncbi:hypothetical protein [Arhodomonas sp. SL1]|uniref:hypothetical protein n=1 Tax=Arhodomonas sp. SL1 TaxID=3425691 RepID=UPI003F883B0C
MNETDVGILAALPPNALRHLAVVRPMVVVRRGRRRYQLLAGHVVYRAMRAAVDPDEAVPVVEVDKGAGASLIAAVERLVLPAIDGAGANPQVVRRWLQAHERQPALWRELGMEGLTRTDLARHLGLSRSRMYRIRDGEDSDRDG